MIKTKFVEQTVVSNNIKHYKNLNYNVKNLDKIRIPVEHLPKKSRCEIEAECDRCRKIAKMRFEHYNKCISNQNFFACSKCSVEKQIQTCRNRYGVDSASQLESVKIKLKKTNLNKYGVESVLQHHIFYEKMKKTNLKKYGVEFVSQLEETKRKCRETSMKNFGVDNHMKTEVGLRKNQISGFHMKKYKNSNLYYQGTYELLFLEIADKLKLLKKISNGKRYKYILNGQVHTYHSDFYFKNSNIEIKSSWTYNKNGKDKELASS